MARNVNKQVAARKQSDAVAASSVAALSTFEKGESEAKAVLAKQVAETKADGALSGDDPLELLRWKMPSGAPKVTFKADRLAKWKELKPSRPALHSAGA